jgi:hypothetical protein
VKLQTRKQRQLRQNLKRVGIGFFLVLFVASIVGVAVVSYTAK